MQPFIQPLNVLIPLVYGAALLFYAGYFTTENRQLSNWGQKFLLSALITHFFYFIARSNFQYFPITNSFDSLSLVAFSIALIYFIIERFIHEQKTGAIFISIVFLFQITAAMFHVSESTAHELLKNPIFGFHVSLTLIGISALAISSLYGLMYWMLAKKIKTRNLGILYRGMPPLEQLERMGRLSSLLGLVILGFGLFLGHLYAFRLLGFFFTADPKILINDVAWLAYLLGWLVIKWKNLSGLRLSKLSFWGFLAFAGAIMTANLIKDTFHQFN